MFFQQRFEKKSGILFVFDNEDMIDD